MQIVIDSGDCLSNVPPPNETMGSMRTPMASGFAYHYIPTAGTVQTQGGKTDIWRWDWLKWHPLSQPLAVAHPHPIYASIQSMWISLFLWILYQGSPQFRHKTLLSLLLFFSVPEDPGTITSSASVFLLINKEKDSGSFSLVCREVLGSVGMLRSW